MLPFIKKWKFGILYGLICLMAFVLLISSGCSQKGPVIYYEGNGSTSGKTQYSQTYQGKDLKLSKCGFKRKGYSFLCWNSKKDGSGTDYLEGQTLKSVDGKENIKLYAKWMPKKIWLVVQTTDKSLKLDADANYANFDVVIDGKTENSDLWFKTYIDANAKFKIMNIQPEKGYIYKGIHTVTDMNKGIKTVNLVFEKKG